MENPSATDTAATVPLDVSQQDNPTEVVGQGSQVSYNYGSGAAPQGPTGIKPDQSKKRRSWISDRLWKLGLLFWKNLILMRRHYLITLMEIAFPLLVFVALGLLGGVGRGPQGRSDDLGRSSKLGPQHDFDEMNLMSEARGSLGEPMKIAYFPKNNKTIEVMSKLESCLSRKKEWGQPHNYHNKDQERYAKKPHETTEKMEMKAFDNEAEIEIEYSMSPEYKVAVIFQDGLDNWNNDEAVETEQASYKIRMGIREFEGISNTKDLYSGRNSRDYARNGFIGLQICIDKSLMQLLTNEINVSSQYNYTMDGFGDGQHESSEESESRRRGPGYSFYADEYWKPGFIFVYLPMVISVIRKTVSERQTGIRELLRLNDVPGWLQSVGWMLNPLLVSAVMFTIGMILLYVDISVTDNGPSLTKSDPSVWFILLLLNTISVTAFCFFISAFFTNPAIATSVGMLIYFGGGLLTWFIRDPDEFSSKMGLALLPFYSVAFTVKISHSWEVAGFGLRWTVVDAPLNPTDEFTLCHVILMIFISSALYIFLASYLENVLPSEYGVRKPLYYMFQPIVDFIISRIRRPDKPPPNQLEATESTVGFETPPINRVVGIDVKDLRKQFGRKKVAVSGVSTSMYFGEIYALLGHNGAGKTTTISMLTGMFAPTSGTAMINGYDIRTHLDRVRESLGLCPQHNMLFEKLTVKEHLFFFGRLKGLSHKEATRQSDMFLATLHFQDKAKTKSSALSGGQKRKLSMGVALIGESKVVILDEPTSGMDPEARRAIWDILQSLREGRTILITTHFSAVKNDLMEEADVLGDRIGIMAEGKLQCCGTSIFLKNVFGGGYTLKLTITPEGQRDDVLTFVRNYVPDASYKHVVAANPTEVLITLPNETATKPKLLEMFSGLDNNKGQLHILTVGLSVATIDDVFVKVGELSGHSSEGSTENQAHTQSVIEQAQSNPRSSGCVLILAQIIGLLFKKSLYVIRRWKLPVIQVFFPVIIVAVALLMIRSSERIIPQKLQPSLSLNLKSYENPITLFTADGSMLDYIKNTVKGSKSWTQSDIKQQLGSIQYENSDFFAKYIVALEVTSKDDGVAVNALYNKGPNHAAPVAINLASNIMLRHLDNSTRREIKVANYPLQSPLQGEIDVTQGLNTEQSSGESLHHIVKPFYQLTTAALCILGPTFLLIPMEEKISKAKHLQLMTGVNSLTYWITHMTFDSVVAFLIGCAITLCFPIFQSYQMFTSYSAAGVGLLIVATYLMATLPMVYLITLLSGTGVGGFSFLLIPNIFVGNCFGAYVIFICENEREPFFVIVIFRWIMKIFPIFGTALSLAKFAQIVVVNARCNFIPDEGLPQICGSTVDELYAQICCKNCDSLGIKDPCFKPLPFLTWDDQYYYEFKDGISVPGIGQELFFVFIVGLIYLVILFFIELGFCRKAKAAVGGADLFTPNIDDEDVWNESQRVQEMVQNNTTNQDALVVHNFCKSYGTFAAVSNLSFAVHHGECFGLLGVNGAGKTTTFRMLTGDEICTLGNAYSSNTSLERNSTEFKARIGYCPQYDAIIDGFTGKDMIMLYGMLRGVPICQVKSDATLWLEKMGLAESGNVKCQNYSGGMKRRLSAATALVGEPALVLLDEPTSGVDPVARRQFWKVLESVKSSGQSIILTSHSMDECEALCSRLGIMVNGQLRCLGGVQHLKHKFAQGYSITIKLTSDMPEESLELRQLNADVIQKFQPCTLKDVHQNILQYQVENTTIPWNVMFQTLEDLKTKNETMIEDYSVNETSLEDVFLSFARTQYGERKAEMSLCKKCITCSC